MVIEHEILRILVVASTFPASDDDAVPAFVRDQVIALKKVKPEIHFMVLAPHDSRSTTRGFKRHEHFDEYRFHYFWPRRLERLSGRGIMPALQSNPLNYLLAPFFLFSEYQSLKQLVRKTSPSLIYAHWFMPNAVIAAFVCRRFNIPLVFTSHSSDIQVMNKLPFGTRLARSVMNIVAKWTVVSKNTKSKAEKVFLPEDWARYSNRMKVISMGIDVKHITFSKNRVNKSVRIEGLEGTADFMLFIGRLAEVKGVHTLIQATALMKGDNTKLVIAGEGPEMSTLMKLAENLGVREKTLFVGHVSGNTKNYLLSHAKLLIVPSTIDRSRQTEGFPVVLMEGMAYGKVILASNVSGGESVLKDGVDGFIFDHENPQDLADKISVGLRLNKSSRLKISESVFKLAKEYDWEVIARKHYEFLFRLPMELK